MLFYIIYFNRAESSKTYVKSYMGNIYALGFHLFQKFFGEMQTCCRSCCGTLILCINSLVAILILLFMSDIWRQRHLSQLVQNLLKNAFIMELDQTVAFVHHVDDLAL